MKLSIPTDIREAVRVELPELAEISDPNLRELVIDAWALCLSQTQYKSISEVPPSGDPGYLTLKTGTQAIHIRGVARLAMRLAEEMSELCPDFHYDRDVLIAGALCHDVGKPWEFDPRNRARWEENPRRTGLPPIRHPAYGAHICMMVGMPEKVMHVVGAHSHEGDLVIRSLESTIVVHADRAFWRTAKAADILVPESVPDYGKAKG